MTSSEQDTSESSNYGSPFSHSQYSPLSYNNSPSQVIYLTNGMTELACEDVEQAKKPFLQIIEQPQSYFRFRYKSEMIGTHGCLLGDNYIPGKPKSHPTVELCNYSGSAVIGCHLVRHDADLEHPHTLTEDDQDKQISSVLPQRGSYKVGFGGMGIIHTAKKEVSKLLYNKYTQCITESNLDEHALRVKCDNEAKRINLNIVRLKFTAHDVSGSVICPPVFSNPIHNMKSAETNDLRICRSSRWHGRAAGGDEVFIFVEKVNRKNIQVRFFETDESGDRIWSKEADFQHGDVHHQYAIAFRTPAYRDKSIASNVEVKFELVRPSDGRVSAPLKFLYKADPFLRHNKKRKATSSNSSLSSLGGSIKSFSDLPLTVNEINENVTIKNIEVPAVQNTFICHPSQSTDLMADALLEDISECNSGDKLLTYTSPMLGQPNVPPVPVLHFNSSEMFRLLETSGNGNLPSEERRRYVDSMNLAEYLGSFSENTSIDMNPVAAFLRSSVMMADDSEKLQYQGSTLGIEVQTPISKIVRRERKETPDEYSAAYTVDDGAKVKDHVRDLCEMIRNKSRYKKEAVRNKLTQLFDVRLSNGDTFLHMSVNTRQPSVKITAELSHSLGMAHLLNLQNRHLQTALHLATAHNHALIPLLIRCGCDPMLQDEDGNNAVHYAVIYDAGLEHLLKAMDENNVPRDLDVYNYDRQTAAHLCAVLGRPRSLRRLLRAGARAHVPDGAGRAALHLATGLADYEALLAAIAPSDIDMVDGRGYTALQLVCDRPVSEETLQIARLLLEKKADPKKFNNTNKPAWQLAMDKPELMKILQDYGHISPGLTAGVSKVEPEDEYESSEESCDESEPELTVFHDTVPKILDGSGGWRDLA
ncbi:putative transcription factor p65 homolog isoform X2 [Leptidea sinapis]|uniref:putative transcription factor p65 homolog isoform X2 n=1 Tax=Leptidea sinapis TaxID=189913 RepID=UPI00212525FF|nr:putative transcription factor p65 homolog isoform X2 [Leptidea sinapis]